MIRTNAFDYINVLDKAADASWLRDEAINNNIANVDTPGYKREDITFQSELRTALKHNSYDTMDDRVSHLSADRLKPRTYNDYSGFSYRLDGNNVDIDTDKMELTHAPSLSSPDEIYNTLRWVAILSKKLRCDISASTGVHTADDVVKMLLAGAGTVQVVSCLYKNGVEYMRTLNDGLRDWMNKKGYESIEQFRGKLAAKANEQSSMLYRTQFMKHFAQI